MQSRDAILLDAPAVADQGELDRLVLILAQPDNADTDWPTLRIDIDAFASALESRLAKARAAIRGIMALRPRPSEETPEGF